VHRIKTIIQARPLWEYSIRNEIKQGNNVLVVAHTNSLRALMRVIDGKKLSFKTVFGMHTAQPLLSTCLISIYFSFQLDISENDIQEVSMPSGIPFVYKVRRLYSWRH
jgi:bisphosphoglycerate-dependent phosphoglycerate mutase